jgi:hypothetical protein
MYVYVYRYGLFSKVVVSVYHPTNMYDSSVWGCCFLLIYLGGNIKKGKLLGFE